MAVFIDSSILMYTAGGDHPLRDPCVRIMDRVSSGVLAAVTSTEVVQEIFHRYLSIRRPEIAITLAGHAMDIFAPVLPITHAVIRRMPDLVARYPELQARDLIHVATCIHEGISDIISADGGFDQVVEMRRIDPVTFAS